MQIDQIQTIMKNHHLHEIFSVGVVDLEETGLAEFVTLMDRLFFEFGEVLIKMETIEQYSKLALTAVNSIQFEVDLEDVILAKARIGNFVFNNPLTDNKVAEIVLYNMENKAEELICDALKIVLLNQQEIFIDPSFLGINIGGPEVEAIWRYNLADNYTPVPTILKINSK
ncbi:hypothetical protein R70723_21845 [Paenibacillus sp. FSL R7-0273]|uniref:hypothetical protein n=1 Tax=Paenibacillus sp. FSL R7-0273 TaxID=1536772 RepID=UPI0004F8C69C|nr:hypothetical protein [Paenibacillus sp. FSL R7-0273]AIQ48261.1 hypothetical protein R70723_21845 [Paenibacillus sp. FSL R7-0273]OMF92027.1 hypothetical protein BK144_14895 [Paenibacillus sp. FSL R7-0273]